MAGCSLCFSPVLPPAIPYRDTKGGIRIFLSRVSLEFDYEQTERHEGLTYRRNDCYELSANETQVRRYGISSWTSRGAIKRSR